MLLIIVCTSSYATLIKGKTKVYKLPNEVTFAVLYDGSFVREAWNPYWTHVLIDFDCYVGKSNLANGKLVTKTVNVNYGQNVILPRDEIFMIDTVYLYSDTSLMNITGYAYPASDSGWINFDDIKKSSTYLRCELFGGVDSSSILEFDPWNGIIDSIEKHDELFKMTFVDLNTRMSSIQNYCTDIKGKGIEYSETYDEDNPTPGVALLYVFRDGVLKALWTEQRLAQKNRERLDRGYFYFDESMRSRLKVIRKKVVEMLDYTP